MAVYRFCGCGDGPGEDVEGAEGGGVVVGAGLDGVGGCEGLGCWARYAVEVARGGV